ncbi:MAG: cytochrome c-type biogenesis protein CcmH [Deltaproteobacteria bacterium]|jgi:cytochrome c-type biogenesis protein CcmH|nr:cytochrome c-type biogenesis protein CcmH [Deltaproteobacteria bacterium]MBT4526987.1 cytochrome c-type biogenesis protein CcmH [Deltaproteobacteria bacterium]
MMTSFKSCLVIFSSLLLFSINFLYAQSESEIENRVRTLANQLRCPTCQSQSVKDSDAGLSLNMKIKIRDLIQKGQSDAEVLDYFVKRYGEWILRSPPKSGFNLLLWIMPGIIMLIATLVLLRSLKQKSRTVDAIGKPSLSKAEDLEISRRFNNVFKNK